MDRGLDTAEIEKQLELSKCRQIINSSSDAIIATDTSGYVTMWNEGAERIYGYRQHEAIGQPITIIYHEKDYPYLESLIARLNQGEHIDSVELTLLRKDKTEVDVLFSLSTIKDDNGTIVELVGITKDITERRSTERTLSQRLRYEHAVAEVSTRLANAQNSECVVPDALASLLDAFRASRVYIFENFDDPDDGLCMRQVFEVCAPGITPEIDNPILQHVVYSQGYERWRHALAAGTDIHGHIADFPDEERAILEPQGILSILILPLFVDGKWWGLIGFDETRHLRDWQDSEVTLLGTTARMLGSYFTRQRAQERLELVAAELKLAQRISKVGNWFFDPAVGVPQWSDEVFRIYERDPELGPIPLSEYRDIYSPEQFEVFRSAISAAIEHGTPYNIELHLRLPSGSEKWVHAICEPLPAKGPAGYCLLGTIQDITEEKKTEEALRKDEAAVRRRLKAIIEPENDSSVPALEDIIDVPAVQALMESLHRITGTGSAIVDNNGKVLVGVGWQDICTRFHRCHPESLSNCIESDTILANGAVPGTFKKYQCRNGLWDMASPIVVSGQHLGNIFFGQFFYSDEEPDVEQFRTRAQQFGFDESEYLTALSRVPRYEREMVENVMSFYSRLGEMISSLSFSTLSLAQTLTERKRAELALRESEEMMRFIVKHDPNALAVYDNELRYIAVSDRYLQDYDVAEVDIIGKHHYEVFPEMPERWKEVHRRVLAGATERNDDDSFVRSDGSITYNRWECRPWYRSDGSIAGMITYTEVTTERKKNELLIRGQKAQLQTLLETIPDLVWLKDPDGTYLTCNRRLCDFFGATADEIVGKTDYDFVDNELADSFRAHDKSAVEAGRPTIYEEEITFKSDGHKEVVETIKTPMLDPEGNLLGVLGICRDVTERRIAAERLRESEDLLNRTGDMAQVGGWEVDLDTKKVIWTRVTGRIHELPDGYSPDLEEAIGYYHPEDQEHVSQCVQRAMDKAESFDFTVRLVTANGRERWVRALGQPVFDSGRCVRLSGTFQDITESKQAEELLRESEEKFRSYVDNSPNGMFVTNSEGFYVDANPAAEKLTGYTRDELISMHVSDLIPADDRENARKRFETLRDGGEPPGVPTSYLTKSGEIRYWIISAVKLSDDRLIGFVNDVTEELRLRKLESRAERLEMAGTVAGQVAHDFNNLLGPLVAYPDFLKESVPHDHEAVGYLEDIKSSALRISEINNDLLTLSRRGHYNMDVLDLNAIIQSAIREFSQPGMSISFNVNLDSELLPVKGGSAQLHRVLNNILNNAVDACGDYGEITVATQNFYSDETSVRFGMVPKGEYVKCTIADTGCGMASDVLDKVFDPFFTTKKAGSKRGSGLGMSVVRAVMDDHGGYIDMYSRIGSGSSVYLYFPVCREAEEESADENRDYSSKDALILVVDDDDIQRKVTGALLEKSGYRVASVSSGEEAVAFCKSNEPDLLVLDMIMPDGIDGAETYKRIHKVRSGQKAILLSGQSESDRVRQAQSLGAGAFVRKPVTKSTLSRVIARELAAERR